MAETYVMYSLTRQKFYVGATREIATQRLQAHNAGKTRSTKSGRPWRLVHLEKYDTYNDARRRELFLKSGIGRAWITERFGRLKNNGGVA